MLRHTGGATKKIILDNHVVKIMNLKLLSLVAISNLEDNKNIYFIT